MKSILVFVCLVSSIEDGICQNSLLWEITGRSLKDTSYLYGTIHIADKRVFKFGDSLMIAFNRCSSFAGEIVIDEVSKKAAAKELLMPGDTTLELLIGDSGLAKVKQRVKKQSRLFAALVNKVRPFYVMAFLAQGNFQSNKSVTLDEYFQKEARKNKMKVLGLESVSDQIAAVNTIPLDQQAEMLMEEVNLPIKDNKEQAEKMLLMYLEQQVDSLAAYGDSAVTSDQFSKVFLTDRNHVMAQKIVEFSQREAVFVAIGAAHLGGMNGVIELLRKKGYSLRPINAPFKF